jgi:hypothetical protein
MHNTDRALWLALIVLGALASALAAGWAFHANGGTVPGSLTAAGSTFAGAFAIGLAARQFLG